MSSPSSFIRNDFFGDKKGPRPSRYPYPHLISGGEGWTVDVLFTDNRKGVQISGPSRTVSNKGLVGNILDKVFSAEGLDDLNYHFMQYGNEPRKPGSIL
ncbi:hypothetical protein CDAR_38581 [Caerostris darwini]|uniref:Uncharacterized protein n=1 Tax=Caerostris darwini TaxID=1538125 RepID=A0AAV4UQ41_9ARAC|nr:hypothetical protein CDAR_38581 [Caerostris darwini]